MIRVLLFDVDGVLANGENWAHHLARDYGISAEQLAPFFKERFSDCVTGKADLKQELSHYLPRWGWQKSVDDLLDYWFMKEHVIDELIISYVQQVRQQGIACYIATMQEKYRTTYILEQMGFASKFDGIFSSAYIGYKKNEPSFYEKILRQLTGITASEILFWDDSQKNVETARQVGLYSELYTDFTSFVDTMKNYQLIA